MSDQAARFTQDDVNRIVETRLATERDRIERRARVVSEPRIYSLDSPHSYYADFYFATTRPQQAASANERLTRYAQEVAHEIERRSPEGLRAERVIRNHTRVPDPEKHERRHRAALAELRAATTGGGATASASGGGAAAFVTPYFLESEWAMFRGIHRTFANQCMRLPLPAYGMQVYVPTFSSAAGAAQHSESGAVTETDPGSALQGAAVVDITGQVTITQAVHDRGWTGGGTLDALIHRQIMQQLDQQVDSYVLTTAIAAAGVTTNNTPWTANTLVNFFTDLALAREGLTDTAGVRMWPTRLVTTSDFFSYVSHIFTTGGQPALVNAAQTIPGIPVDGDRDDPDETGTWTRFTGVIMPGALPWFLDDNIPTAGGTANNTQVIVSASQESLLLLEDPNPVLTVFDQSSVASSLNVILNARQYVALVTRHASGTQVITGSAYPSSNK